MQSTQSEKKVRFSSAQSPFSVTNQELNIRYSVVITAARQLLLQSISQTPTDNLDRRIDRLRTIRLLSSLREIEPRISTFCRRTSLLLILFLLFFLFFGSRDEQ